jgi:GNAT superfamily N-acetyltransferase
LVRYVTPSVDQALVDELQAPGTWVKTCSDLPELDARWTVEPTEYLMAVELTPTGRQAPYAVSTTSSGPLIRVGVEIDGLVAARGQVAVWHEYAVVDQVVTEPAYRRRGLGSLVMRALSDAAVEQGARTGVLVATDAGRALYSRLGWELVSPVRVAWISRG